ncbi:MULTISPECIES: hypothetical protein [unclassified Caballeronia]|uniref:hypothetical protein n=1 Tax=unclassified Caballeronia TaxID=2646786 RepID=UPI002029AA7C|nr:MULTISPECIES: hypothetical protein [unclassified Caballeronia]
MLAMRASKPRDLAMLRLRSGPRRPGGRRRFSWARASARILIAHSEAIAGVCLALTLAMRGFAITRIGGGAAVRLVVFWRWQAHFVDTRICGTGRQRQATNGIDMRLSTSGGNYSARNVWQGRSRC